MAVVPERARLFGQRHLGDPLGEFRIVEVAEIDAVIGGLHQPLAIEAIGDAGGVQQQILDIDRPEGTRPATAAPAKEGIYLLTGSPSASLRRSTSIIAAKLVMVLVTEWIGKMASAVIGVPASTSRLPKHLKYTGRPWCWIRTMAPGMLPEAISPLIKSSMAESFSRDSTACGGGQTWAAETVATV